MQSYDPFRGNSTPIHTLTHVTLMTHTMAGCGTVSQRIPTLAHVTLKTHWMTGWVSITSKVTTSVKVKYLGLISPFRTKEAFQIRMSL